VVTTRDVSEPANLRWVLTEYLHDYNAARPHRALGQLAPAQAHARPPQIYLPEHRIRRKQVFGGLTHEYPNRCLTASRCLKKRAAHFRDRVLEPHRVDKQRPVSDGFGGLQSGRGAAGAAEDDTGTDG
jgi:hypothetical protein